MIAQNSTIVVRPEIALLENWQQDATDSRHVADSDVMVQQMAANILRLIKENKGKLCTEITIQF